MNHPSFLALDRHALAPVPGEIAAHLEACAQCAAHVATVQRLEPAPFALPPRAVPRPLRPKLALAACAAVLLALVIPRLQRGETLTPKGLAPAGPAALLWVKGDGAAYVWRSGEKLRSGVSVRFEIAPASFDHLTVVDLAGAPHILYEVGLTETTPTLSPAWKLEPSSKRDELAVILSHAALSDAELPGVLCEQTARAWCTRFTLEQAP